MQKRPFFVFLQAEDGIRDVAVTGVQTCALPISQPGRLHAAGVMFAISTFDASDSRTVPYEAGFAVPYGLPEEEALRAITVYPARILGVGDQLGTIQPGKIANLIVTDGNPLEIRTR